MPRGSATLADPSPRLSVVMSVYNGERHLASAIESVLEQDFGHFEFLIVDDGSRDGTAAILARYAARDPRIRIIEQKNTGLTIALRNAIAQARAPLIARMDADDLSLPGRFARQVELLDRRPDLVAVTCHVEHFRDDGTIRSVSSHIGPEALIPLYNTFCNRIGGHGQVVFRRAAYEAVGGYDPAFRYSQDYDLWTRLTEHGGFGVIEDVLYRWRVEHGSITDRNKSAQLECAIRVAQREHEKLTGIAMDRATALALIAFWWARKPEKTPMPDTIKASRAMDRAICCFFRRSPELAHLEDDVRRSIMANWRYRIALANKANLPRRTLLAAQAVWWAASRIARH